MIVYVLFFFPSYRFRNPRDPAGKERPLILGTDYDVPCQGWRRLADGSWDVGLHSHGTPIAGIFSFHGKSLYFYEWELELPPPHFRKKIQVLRLDQASNLGLYYILLPLPGIQALRSFNLARPLLLGLAWSWRRKIRLRNFGHCGPPKLCLLAYNYNNPIQQ